MLDAFFYARYGKLFQFLLECNKSKLEKSILDCGAGGSSPPLQIFHDQGYKVKGIDIDENQMEKARTYQKEKGIDLNISIMDMRELTLAKDSTSFAYSFSTIFHMTKKEMQKSIDNIFDVLSPGGKFYVNLMTTNCSWYLKNKNKSVRGEEGELYLMEGGEEVLHSFLSYDECEKMLEKFNILRKEIVSTYFDEDNLYEEIHYFVEKPIW